MVSPLRKVSAVTLGRWFSGLACAAVATHTHAQAPRTLVADKLSSRLLSAPAFSEAQYMPWVTDPSLKLEQQLRKDRILAQLALYPELPGTAGLIAFLESLPVTGRLTPVQTDVAALLVNPSADYQLSANTITTPLRIPAQASVLTGDGQVCQVGIRSSVAVETLLGQCPSGEPSDEAWVIQADGVSTRVFTSRWNRHADVLVAPGAWVWQPPRLLQDNLALCADIAQFLATQALPSSAISASPLQDAHSDEAQGLGWKPYFSGNDWGETGLLQTPTARTGELGNLRVNFSRAYPYTRMNVFLQPTAWLEFGFRYTDIATRLYGATIAGEQTYKDKSFDFKTVLRQEDAMWPQVAVGMRDIGGTGLFSSEYVVASKRTESLDWSLGIGWGNMAAGSTLDNPLGALFPSLKQRKADAVGQGGTISTSSMFAGNAALFGGVQWTLPSGRHVLKLEVEGNRYTQEPFGQDLEAKSPVNVGWLYRISPGTDLNLALERGNKLAFSVTFTDNLRTMGASKPLDPPALRPIELIAARTTPITPMGVMAPPADLHSQLTAAIQTQTGWKLLSVDNTTGAWQLVLETDDAVYASERLERLFDIVSSTLPSEGKMVDIELRNFGLGLRSVSLNREEWLAQRVYPETPALQLQATQWGRPGMLAANTEPIAPPSDLPPASRLETGWGPVFAPILGGPNNFVLYQAGLRAYGQYRFNANTWAFGQANLRLADNYNNFVYDAPSKLPRVRTDQRQYVTTSRATMPVAQLTRTFDLGNGHYASAYGGLLEPMYAGVGAEWLWRPWNANWAFGVDVNQVQQRAYEQDLGLRDYRTTTGHATLYWNTGINGIQAKFLAGQYLAKDVGVTVELSRTFANGTSIGVWATKTNVSAEQFGEGSFDKGIYISVPFDAMLPRSTPSVATLAWSPLSRDGGARLGRQFPLYDLTRHADSSVWRFRSANPQRNRTEEDEESTSLGNALFPHRPGQWGLGASMQLGRTMGETSVNTQALAIGAGAVLLTMVADQSIANNLGSQPGGSSPQYSHTLNNIPYLLAAGVGTAAIGTWGEDARTTAYASLSATTWALGVNLVGKSLIGRARPDEGQGAWEFKGPHSGSPQSSFASNHVTAAMALATPFAQRYEQPWLYGLAALTAVGRVQTNAHWASDTVAGALLGYAFGTLALENQSNKHKGWKFSASLQGVQANTSF